MSEESGRYLCYVSLVATGLLGAWTARGCREARRHGLFGSDDAVWGSVAVAFLLFAQTKLARAAGWLKGFGVWLRVLAKQHDLYANRRPYQIAASLAVALVVVVLLVIGLVSMWNYIKRYRLAVGFASLAVGYAVIRFISLHEMDAWNAAMPWLHVVIEVTASLGASAVAVARLWQLRDFALPRQRILRPSG